MLDTNLIRGFSSSLDGFLTFRLILIPIRGVNFEDKPGKKQVNKSKTHKHLDQWQKARQWMGTSLPTRGHPPASPGWSCSPSSGRSSGRRTSQTETCSPPGSGGSHFWKRFRYKLKPFPFVNMSSVYGCINYHLTGHRGTDMRDWCKDWSSGLNCRVQDRWRSPDSRKGMTQSGPDFLGPFLVLQPSFRLDITTK